MTPVAQYDKPEPRFVVLNVCNAMHQAAAGGGKLSRSSVLGENRAKATIAELTQHKGPEVRDPGTIIFAQDDRGVAAMSMMRQARDECAVVLESLSGDGIARLQTLSRLPEDLNEKNSVLVSRNDQHDADSIRLVFNLVHRNEIWVKDASQAVVQPVVFDRKKDSIPTFETKVKGMLTMPVGEAFSKLGDLRGVM